MRNSLPYLAPLSLVFCLVGFAQQPAERPTKPVEKPAENPADKAAGKAAEKGLKLGTTSEAETLLDEAIVKIEALKQYRSDVRQVVEMLGYKFVAEGQYAVGPDFHMLFELKVQLSDTTGTLKEVCDGRVHWKHQQVLDTPQVVKIDLKKIREILDRPQFNKELRDQLVQRLGFSGVVPLMRGLRENQKFESFEEQTLGDVPVYVLDGHWREEAISQTAFRGQQLSLANLPPYIPNKTMIWIGREDGWPYRVRMESNKKVQGSATSLTIEFQDPQMSVELPESLFVFEPPSGLRVEDQTDSIYQQLNSFMQQMQDTAAKPRVNSSATSPLETKPKGKLQGVPDETPSKPARSQP
jgi:hypothetical protein